MSEIITRRKFLREGLPLAAGLLVAGYGAVKGVNALKLHSVRKGLEDKVISTLYTADVTGDMEKNLEHTYMIVEGARDGVVSVEAYEMIPNPVTKEVSNKSYGTLVYNSMQEKPGRYEILLLSEMVQLYNGGSEPLAQEAVDLPVRKLSATEVQALMKKQEQFRVVYRGPKASKPIEPGFIKR